MESELNIPFNVEIPCAGENPNSCIIYEIKVYKIPIAKQSVPFVQVKNNGPQANTDPSVVNIESIDEEYIRKSKLSPIYYYATRRDFLLGIIRRDLEKDSNKVGPFTQRDISTAMNEVTKLGVFKNIRKIDLFPLYKLAEDEKERYTIIPLFLLPILLICLPDKAKRNLKLSSKEITKSILDTLKSDFNVLEIKNPYNIYFATYHQLFANIQSLHSNKIIEEQVNQALDSAIKRYISQQTPPIMPPIEVTESSSEEEDDEEVRNAIRKIQERKGQPAIKPPPQKKLKTLSFIV
jgi:hypothetical protein